MEPTNSPEPVVCDTCGKETPLEGAYYRVQHSLTYFSRRCPTCWLKSQKEQHGKSLLVWFILALIGTGLVLTGSENSGWFILNVVCFYLLLIVAAVPHEFGHAFAAKAVGFRAFFVTIGFGKPIFEKLVWGIDFRVGSIPLGGFAGAASKTTTAYRLRLSFITFSGPGANLLVAALLYLFLPEEFLTFNITDGLRLPALLIGANVWCAAYSLWPKMVATSRGTRPNDGLLLWRTIRMSGEDVKNTPLHYYHYETAYALKRGELEAAEHSLEEGLAKFPDDFTLLSLRGNNLIDLGKYSEAREQFAKLLDRPEISKAHRTVLLNNVAYADTLVGGEELIKEADRYSEEAFASMHFSAAVKGTRGCALVELGRVDEGIALLKASLEEADNPLSKAKNACHIAIAEKRRGNFEESRKYTDLARSFDAKCILFDRLI